MPARIRGLTGVRPRGQPSPGLVVGDGRDEHDLLTVSRGHHRGQPGAAGAGHLYRVLDHGHGRVGGEPGRHGGGAAG